VRARPCHKTPLPGSVPAGRPRQPRVQRAAARQRVCGGRAGVRPAAAGAWLRAGSKDRCWQLPRCKAWPAVQRRGCLSAQRCSARCRAAHQRCVAVPLCGCARRAQGNDVLFMMGSDFQFANAHANFINMDRCCLRACVRARVRVRRSCALPRVHALLATAGHVIAKPRASVTQRSLPPQPPPHTTSHHIAQADPPCEPGWPRQRDVLHTSGLRGSQGGLRSHQL
jgi:hypothetical protein